MSANRFKEALEAADHLYPATVAMLITSAVEGKTSDRVEVFGSANNFQIIRQALEAAYNHGMRAAAATAVVEPCPTLKGG